MSEILDYVLQALGAAGSVSETGEGRWKAHCPNAGAHKNQDKQSSFSVFRSKSGDAYLCKCHNPSCELTQTSTLYTLCDRMGWTDAPKPPVKTKKKRKIDSLPTQQQIDKMRDGLRRAPDILARLIEDWTLRQDVIDTFEVGYDGKCLWIPIRDADGALLNVRRKPMSGRSTGKTHGITGHNAMQIYPMRVLEKNDFVILAEGEKDALVGLSHRLPCVTVTSGAGSWDKQRFTPLFADKRVAIIYDVDKAGKSGALTVKQHLINVAEEVKLVQLPEDQLPSNGDLTDYLTQVGTAEQVHELIENTHPATEHVNRRSITNDPLKIDLLHAHAPRFCWKAVEFRAQVVGKDMSPYSFPLRMTLSCVLGKEKCVGCAIRERGKLINGAYKLDVEINRHSDEVLKLIGCTTKTQRDMLARILRVGCNAFTIEHEERGMIEEVFISDELDKPRIIRTDRREDDEKLNGVTWNEPEIFRAFVMNQPNRDERVGTNRGYVFTGSLVPDPKTQKDTHVLWGAEETEESVKSFTADSHELEELTIFCVEE